MDNLLSLTHIFPKDIRPNQTRIIACRFRDPSLLICNEPAKHWCVLHFPFRMSIHTGFFRRFLHLRDIPIDDLFGFCIGRPTRTASCEQHCHSKIKIMPLYFITFLLWCCLSVHSHVGYEHTLQSQTHPNFNKWFAAKQTSVNNRFRFESEKSIARQQNSR